MQGSGMIPGDLLGILVWFFVIFDCSFVMVDFQSLVSQSYGLPVRCHVPNTTKLMDTTPWSSLERFYTPAMEAIRDASAAALKLIHMDSIGLTAQLNVYRDSVQSRRRGGLPARHPIQADDPAPDPGLGGRGCDHVEG